MLSHSSASSTWRSWLNFFGVFFFRFFFSLKKLSQLDAIELARCPWARAMCLSELDGAEPARCSWASSQEFPNVVNCQVQSPLITLVLDMVPLKKPKVTVKTYPWWNWASYMFWASSKKWKIVNSTIQYPRVLRCRKPLGTPRKMIFKWWGTSTSILVCGYRMWI